MTITARRAFAAAEVILIFPAALFMTSLFVRNWQPLEYEPARTAARIVDWYAARTHLGLWVFLFAFPLAVLAGGGIMLGRSWRTDSQLREASQQALAIVRTHLATLLVAIATLAAGGFLAIVALHAMTG